jgi:hypothetical protein
MANKNEQCSNQDMIIEHSQILSCIPDMQEDIHVLRTKLIDGNGTPGLIVKHELLSEKFETHVSQHKKSEDNQKWILGLVITIIIAIVANTIALYNIVTSSDAAEISTHKKIQTIENYLITKDKNEQINKRK